MLRRSLPLLKNTCAKLLKNRSSHCTASFSRTIVTSGIMSSSKLVLSDKYKGLESNVWVEFIQLALENKPLNLGQGFPDFAAPEHVTRALADVATDANILLHQYTRGYGHPRLVQALATLYSKLVNRNLNPNTEVLVTAGAYEALFCSIMGFVNPGDEVIIIEPFFDCYEPMVRLAGGKPVFIPLKPKHIDGATSSGDWVLDEEELAGLFNSKTKAIIVNTPHNPLGKVFKASELQVIADLCKKWDVLCISDEVYEWLVYKPYQHVRMATLPGMWERTVTIGSAGKTFSVTGWKLGWAYGPANLIKPLMTAHQNALYTCPTPTQEAAARGFEIELERYGTDASYFTGLPALLESKRDYMAKFLNDAGLKPVIPEGGYFMLADWSSLAHLADLSEETDPQRDYRFVKWMSKKKKLQGIPPSAFYSEPNKALGEDYIRFCFIKEDKNLEKAEAILKEWKNSVQSA